MGFSLISNGVNAVGYHGSTQLNVVPKDWLKTKFIAHF